MPFFGLNMGLMIRFSHSHHTFVLENRTQIPLPNGREFLLNQTKPSDISLYSGTLAKIATVPIQPAVCSSFVLKRIKPRIFAAWQNNKN